MQRHPQGRNLGEVSAKRSSTVSSLGQVGSGQYLCLPEPSAPTRFLPWWQSCRMAATNPSIGSLHSAFRICFGLSSDRHGTGGKGERPPRTFKLCRRRNSVNATIVPLRQSHQRQISIPSTLYSCGMNSQPYLNATVNGSSLGLRKFPVPTGKGARWKSATKA